MFDDFREFLMITWPSGSMDDAEVKERFEEFSKWRKELNLDTPDASSLWYYWIKYVRGEKEL